MSDAALISDIDTTSVVIPPTPAAVFPREGIVYLGTAHGTFVGTDTNSNLVQIHPSNRRTGSLIRIKIDQYDNMII